MRPPFRILPLLLPFLAVGGCAAIFLDDFEADPAGGAPLTMPAGAPADSLDYAEGPGSVSITTALPLEKAQSLRLDGPSGDASPKVIMRAAPILQQTRPVFFSWRGRLGSSAKVEIYVWADFEHFPLKLNFEAGTVYLNGGSIGTFTQTGEHGVFIGIVPNTDEYTISMSGAANLGGAVTGTLTDLDAFPASHVGLTVELINATGPTGYWMDDVRISYWDP